MAAATPQTDSPQADAEAKLAAGDQEMTGIALIYRQKCAGCHGADGRGVADGYSKPLRTDQPVKETAAVIADTMPQDDPDSCVGEESRQLALYIRQKFGTTGRDAGPRVSRLTVEQYRNAVTDVIGSFPSKRAADSSIGGENDAAEQEIAEQEVPGLQGDYYQSRGMNKADQLAHYRSDTRLAFDFGSGSPVPSISADQFAIIWEGGLRVRHTGHYEFRVSTENGARFYLNYDPQPSRRALRDDSSEAGQKALIDAWVGSGELREKTARVFLLGGRTYAIRLEFFKYLEETASVKLEWKPPHGVWSVLDYNHTTSRRPDRVFVCETPFPADDRSLGYERGSSVSPQWQSAIMNGALEAAAEVVDRLPLLASLEEGEKRADRIKEFLLEFASIAYRRPLRDIESELLLQVAAIDEADVEAGVRRAVVMVLMSPHFLYPDLTAGDEEPSPYAVASRLSFGLWDSIPDRELIEAAANGKLSSLEGIHAQAQRMLKDHRAEAKMRSFFRGWLELEERDLSKDNELFPEFGEAVIADLRRSLELFVDNVIWSRESDYRQLLLADYLILNERLKKLYRVEQGQTSGGLDGNEIKRRARRRLFASEFQPVDFPAERRSGILTHPYLLSAHAYHNNTSPIHRGVFLTRSIVGRALNPPPMAVAFKDDEFPSDLTMREKVTLLTRDSACMSCHSIINPLGFALENYDAVGRWRLTEKKKPIDSKSEYQTAAGEVLELASARDVADYAVESESAHRAFITHLFEHTAKRAPADFGPELLDQLREQFVADEFNVQELWARIAAVAAAENLFKPTSLLAEKLP